jgi:predicted nucleotidyltransferase
MKKTPITKQRKSAKMSAEYKFDYKKNKPNRFTGRTKELLINNIREHRADLTRLSVKSMAVFGSVARGEARIDSDVDILVEFEGALTFDRFMDTKFYLEDLLGRHVDLVVPQALKPRLKAQITEDLIYVT